MQFSENSRKYLNLWQQLCILNDGQLRLLSNLTHTHRATQHITVRFSVSYYAIIPQLGSTMFKIAALNNVV